MSRIGKDGVKHGFLCLLILVFANAIGTSQTPVDSQSLPNVPAQGGLPAISANGLPTAGPATLVGAAGEMIGFSHIDGSGTMTITLVHTGKSWMAVYHIDRTGKIRLVSSRAVDADFSLLLNATSPLPDEIRKMGKAN